MFSKRRFSRTILRLSIASVSRPTSPRPVLVSPSYSRLQQGTGIGGASGALIVEGIERANHEAAGLPERVLVIRDQDLLNPNADPYQLNYGAMGADTDEYCNICNPFQYDTSTMTNASIRNAHIQDTANLYSDIADGTLPAVSFVKPSGLVDGHPASSKLDLFEGFTKNIVDAVHANPEPWKDTAIFITFDEGGGYCDSGYVQPVDFFGDGTRIPFIVVSPFTKAGHISHDYMDHVSILKFIERNWNLQPVTSRSRDNFANPVPDERNPYVPVNTPAIGDLFDLFDFGHRR